jgi:DNA primase
VRGCAQAHTHQHITAAPALSELGAEISIAKARIASGLAISDVRYAAVYDSFTITLAMLLEDLGLVPFVKTSGKKGLHVVSPLNREHSFDETRNFVHAVGALLAERSGNIVSEISRTHDPGTVFVDYLQNAPGKTMICPYSLRATDYATVSMPLAWSVLAEGVSPEDFTIQTATTRKEDPWKDFFDEAERLPVINND